jgi:hypothetical protein
MRSIDRIDDGEGLSAPDATRLMGGGAGRDRAVIIAEYTHELEMALLAACLRTPVGIDEVSAVISSKDFQEPAFGRLWGSMITARIECSIITDDMLRVTLAGLDDGLKIEPIIHRLRHPLVKPKSLTKFARDVKRLALERSA